MYMGLQSGSRSVQVISLVKGGLRYDLPGAPGRPAGDTLLFVHVPQLPPELGARANVAVLGSTRESNLNWALDATVAEGQALRWNLGDVIVPQRLASRRIGIVGQVGAEGAAEAEGVYVPVEVRGHAGAPAPGDSTELVIRIAVAAGVRWSTQGASTMQDAERLNVDGYFRIMLPPAPQGEQRITLRWRVRGEPGWKTPEQLRIYRWE
jgi:hypothetical protein